VRGCGGSPVNSRKAKGDKAEREVQELLRTLLDVPARRKLGAGRQDDMGDMDLVPDTVISVANWPSDYLGAVRHKPVECDEQRVRAGARWAATFVRLQGGVYRVVLTPEQWAAYWHEVTP